MLNLTIIYIIWYDIELHMTSLLCRLSPFVSGSVYVAYDVLIITTIPRDADEQRQSLKNSRWPNNWRGSGVGKAFLVIIGLAFIAATIVQLEQFVTKSFHNTIKQKFHWMKPVLFYIYVTFTLNTISSAFLAPRMFALDLCHRAHELHELMPPLSKEWFYILSFEVVKVLTVS